MPPVINCPDCERTNPNCTTCGGTGTYTVPGCPMTFAGHAFFEAHRARAMMEKGLPPVAGGQLDQVPAFLDACRAMDVNDHIIRGDRNANPFE